LTVDHHRASHQHSDYGSYAKIGDGFIEAIHGAQRVAAFINQDKAQIEYGNIKQGAIQQGNYWTPLFRSEQKCQRC